MKVVTALWMFFAAFLLMAGGAGILIFLYSWLLVGLSAGVTVLGALMLWFAMVRGQREATTAGKTGQPD